MLRRVTGSITAEFAADLERGATELRSHRQSYPLKIAKTFAFPESQLGVYTMDASPGILAGDRYELSFAFGERTNVFVTNQSYTKVHPARLEPDAPFAPQHQLQRLSLGAGAYVEYMPEPVMLYKDAHFISETEARLAAGASLWMSELLCPGRTHRGERFLYDLFQNRIAVYYEGELIFSARQRIRPEQGRLDGIGSWDRYTHSGSLYLFSDRLTAYELTPLREELERVASGFDGLWLGVTLGAKHSLIVSAMGNRPYEIQTALAAAWAALRRELYGKPPLAVPK